jgi:hypothetical protein
MLLLLAKQGAAAYEAVLGSFHAKEGQRDEKGQHKLAMLL